MSMIDSSVGRRNHLVICGWKANLGILLREILQANPQWSAADVVVIAGVDLALVENLRSDSKLDGFEVIPEDAFHEGALRRAGLATAAKVLVLADESNPESSETEIDARTIMTMMTIERVAPQIYKIAEMLDPAFSAYLRMAHVDEIIYPREYSRFLLASSVSSPGISHAVYDLLRVETPCLLTTVPIPEELVGRTFADVFRHFDEVATVRTICVGIIENTGNIHVLRRRAKIDAQKTPEYRNVIDRLKSVKKIAANRPMLNPGDNYVIPARAMAVVVQTDATPAAAAV